MLQEMLLMLNHSNIMRLICLTVNSLKSQWLEQEYDDRGPITRRRVIGSFDYVGEAEFEDTLPRAEPMPKEFLTPTLAPAPIPIPNLALVPTMIPEKDLVVVLLTF